MQMSRASAERERKRNVCESVSNSSSGFLIWGVMVSAATKCTSRFWLKAFLIKFFLLFYHWQHNPKWTQNEKLLRFKILVRLCSSFPQLKQPINWIIREHIKSLIYFLSIRDIKASWTTTLWKFWPNPSLISSSPCLLFNLYENSSSINIQVLLDIWPDLCFQ